MAQNKNKGIFNFKNTKLKWLGYGLLCTSTLYTLSAQAALVNIMGDSNRTATFSTGAGTDSGGAVASGSALMILSANSFLPTQVTLDQIEGHLVQDPSSKYISSDRWSITYNGGGLKIQQSAQNNYAPGKAYGREHYNIVLFPQINNNIGEAIQFAHGFSSSIYQPNLPAGDYVLVVVNCPGDNGDTAVATAQQFTNPYPGLSNGTIWNSYTDGYYKLAITGDITNNVTNISAFTPHTSNSIGIINSDIDGLVIKALDLNGKFAYFNITKSLSLGSVVNSVLGGTSTLSITIGSGQILTLTGTSASLDTDGFNANANDYSALGAISFGNNNGTLEINAINNNSITLNNTFSQANNGILQVNTDAIITSASAGTIGNINIGSKPPAEGATGIRPATLTIKPSESSINLSNITFNHLNSMLELDISSIEGDEAWFDSVGVIGTTDTDLSGIVKLNAKTKQLNLGGTSLGINDTKRLKELQILGDSEIGLGIDVFAGSLYFDTTAPVTFSNTADLGSNGSVTLEKDAQLHLTSLFADSPTIDLGQHEISLKEGTMQLTGTPTINTTFDSTTGKMGHIKVVGNVIEQANNGGGGGGGGAPVEPQDEGAPVTLVFTPANSAATLDLSGADSINIVLEADSELPAAGTQYKFPVFVTANGGTINIDHSKINFTSNEQNTYLTWSYANSDLSTSLDDDDENPPSGGGTITGKIDASDLESNISSNDASLSAIDIAKILAKNVEQGNNDAIALVSNLGQMSSNQETLSLEQLVPNPTGAVALMEANDVSGREVTDRVLDNIPLSINIASADELNGEYGIAAGDKPTKYGVWISPFYQKAEQKSYKKNPGYKVTNYGGTIGADTMLSDTTTIGLAWTYLKSELKNQGKAGADKGTTDTNVASFYSFTDLNNNYFISGIAAIGFSKIENNEQRLITRTKTQIAQSKYNSRVYTAKVLGGKQQKVADLFTMIPLIGLRYTQFNDDAYKETGASIQNLSVDKKSSSITELIIGNKFNKLYVTENLWQIRPELSAFAYVNLKEKVATTKISNAAFVNPIELKGVKTSKTWYSLGTAVGITKGLMEYNASYELQLDKKYMGHQAMLKLRVNF